MPLRRAILLLLMLVAGTLAQAVPCGASDQSPGLPHGSPSHAGLRVSVEVDHPRLVAARAIADSLETGVRTVIVRVVDEIDLDLRLESTGPLTLEQPLFLCLTGPDWAPDDAGLSDRCWGEPDLGTIVAEQMSLSAGGAIRLEPGQPILISVRIRRGNERCDYAPGSWELEVGSERPRTPVKPDYVDFGAVAFEVSPAHTEALPLLAPRDSRYCGLATAVVREQGEPEVVGHASMESLDPE